MPTSSGVRLSGPFRRLTADNVAAWNELGYFVLAGVLDLDMIAALTAAIDPFEDEMRRCYEPSPVAASSSPMRTPSRSRCTS